MTKKDEDYVDFEEVRYDGEISEEKLENALKHFMDLIDEDLKIIAEEENKLQKEEK